jgi:hypothetical protein
MPKYAVVRYKNKGVKSVRTVLSKHTRYEEAKEVRPDDYFKFGKAFIHKIKIVE